MPLKTFSERKKKLVTMFTKASLCEAVETLNRLENDFTGFHPDSLYKAMLIKTSV